MLTDLNTSSTEQEPSEDEDHAHIKVFDPLLCRIFIFCEDLPGIWNYVSDGEAKTTVTTLSEIPVYGLFMPFGIARVVQRLPEN